MAQKNFEPELSLIAPAELSAALLSSSPPLILEATTCGTAPPRCVPGAVLFDLAEIDVYEEDAHGEPHRVSGNYSLKPDAAVRAALEAAGVRFDRRAVVYTQCTKLDTADLAVAARLAWTLCVAGVQHVSLLAGGLPAWLAAGLAPAEAHAARAPDAAGFFGGAAGLRFPLCPHLRATTEEVEAAVAAGGGSTAGAAAGAAVAGAAAAASVQLADVRSWREYSGEGHDYPYHVPLGRIPTAVWAHWGPGTYVGGDFYSTATGALRPLEGTAALWRAWGLRLGDETSATRLLFYCGSGWRAALGWCLARLLGHTRCASYDGSILEWAVFSPRAAAHRLEVGWHDAESAPAGVCACCQPHPRPSMPRPSAPSVSRTAPCGL